MNNRYNRDEISKILKRAAELEHADHIIDDSEGLTIKELEQVSKEVGLHPKYIQQAVNDLSNPRQSAAANLLGGPFTYQHLAPVKGTVSDEEWENVVSEIRRIHGGIGKTSTLGHTLQWEQRKREVGYIQIALSPKESHTNIHINANYNYYARVVYGLAALFGLAFFALLFDETNLSAITQLLSVLLGAPILWAGARFYLSNWMKRKRRTYQKLFDRFREMITPEHTKEQDLSQITVSENESHTIEKGVKSGQQKI